MNDRLDDPARFYQRQLLAEQRRRRWMTFIVVETVAVIVLGFAVVHLWLHP